jgi:hypothetical protein
MTIMDSFIDIDIERDGDKFGMIQKLSSLLDKLKKISSGLARYKIKETQILNNLKVPLN